MRCMTLPTTALAAFEILVDVERARNRDHLVVETRSVTTSSS